MLLLPLPRADWSQLDCLFQDGYQHWPRQKQDDSKFRRFQDFDQVAADTHRRIRADGPGCRYRRFWWSPTSGGGRTTRTRTALVRLPCGNPARPPPPPPGVAHTEVARFSGLRELRLKLRRFRGRNVGVFMDWPCLLQHGVFVSDSGERVEVHRSPAEEKQVPTRALPAAVTGCRNTQLSLDCPRRTAAAVLCLVRGRRTHATAALPAASGGDSRNAAVVR